MKRVVASAPGNLFFLGEHAVVYEQPCTIASVGRRTRTTAVEREDKKVTVFSEAFGKASGVISGKKLVERSKEKDELNILLELCEYLLENFELKTGFDLHISSEIPVKSGMSSSTALLSSALRAIGALFGQEVEAEKYWELLYPFQVKLHGGKASGSEIISSSIGGFNQFKKSGSSIKWKHLGELECAVVIADTKVSVPTSMTVGYHVPSLIDRDKEMVMATFKEIGDLSIQAESIIKKGDINAIGELMNRDQELLAKLGISHPKIDDCINEAMNAGALGAKLSGKGWGGIMFALTTKENQDKVAKAMARTRADIIVTDIGEPGVMIE